MLAEGHRLGGSNRQSLPTVQHTFETSGDTRVVVSELCLSTMCRLPKSSAANWRLVPRQTQTCLAVPRLYRVSTVPQTFASTFETRHVVSELCLSTVRRLPKSGAAKQRYVPCQAAPLLAVRQVRPSKLSDVPGQSPGSRRRRRTRRRVPTVCRTWSPVRKNANSQCSAARIHTAGAMGAPFRHVQPAVVDRARAEAGESKTQFTNIMPTSCRSGRARRARYQKKDRPNAVRSKWTTKQTPCHRCRRRRSHRNRTPARQRPLANPKKENHLARPPPRSVAQRLQRQAVHAHLRQFLLANRKKDVRPAAARVFPCRQKSRKPCTSKSPSQFN